MNNRLATCRYALDQRGIGHIAFDQFKAWVTQLQVGRLAGGQIIEDAHRVAFSQQRVAQVRANETGTTGDQNGGISHGGRIDPVGAANRRARRVV
ncbi:hypothetical protein D3C80_1959560 [compost metagenome]